MSSSKIYWKDYLESLKIEKDIRKYCDNCRSEQISKYGKITIECYGMPFEDKVVDKDDLDKLTDEEKKEINSIINPYRWAIDNFIKADGTPVIGERYYQEALVSCTAKRKVYRAGRRIGKALDINTLIPTPNGSRLMKDIIEGDYVYNESGKPTRVTWAGDILENRNCYNIEFSDGSRIS